MQDFLEMNSTQLANYTGFVFHASVKVVCRDSSIPAGSTYFMNDFESPEYEMVAANVARFMKRQKEIGRSCGLSDFKCCFRFHRNKPASNRSGMPDYAWSEPSPFIQAVITEIRDGFLILTDGFGEQHQVGIPDNKKQMDVVRQWLQSQPKEK